MNKKNAMIIGGLLGALVLLPRRIRAAVSGGEQEAVGKTTQSPPAPMAVGVPGKDPQIDALLSEMGAEFRSLGVDTAIVTPKMVTIMRKTPTKAVAIPPKKYWPRMAQTLREIVIPLVKQVGFTIRMGGYRPPDYNAAVGGEPKSRHQWFEAVDMRPEPSTTTNRKELALRAAILFRTLPKDLRMGFGTYGSGAPNTVHVDSGWVKRKWGTAKEWIDKAGEIS